MAEIYILQSSDLHSEESCDITTIRAYHDKAVAIRTAAMLNENSATARALQKIIGDARREYNTANPINSFDREAIIARNLGLKEVIQSIMRDYGLDEWTAEDDDQANTYYDVEPLEII